jgi:hypothetical protein
MALVSEVIKEFKNGFQYLSDEGKRQNRKYEFWFKQQIIRNKYTNTELTLALEQIARDCQKNLEKLDSIAGEKDFDECKHEFFTIIVNTLYAVQIKRFRHGDVLSRTFAQQDKYVLERSILLKKPGFFEQQLFEGLSRIQKTFPAYTDFIQKITSLINREHKTRYPFYSESMKKYTGRLSMYYEDYDPDAMLLNIFLPEDREKYAQKKIPRTELEELVGTEGFEPSTL